MSEKRRVPKNDADFDSYITNTSSALVVVGPPPTYERLGLSVVENDAWQALNASWQAIYPLFTDKNTRTATITAEKNTIKANFYEFASILLTRMSASNNITTSDRNTFNIAKRGAATRRGKIGDVPFGSLEPTALATVKVRIRMAHDGKLSSMHPLADGLELRWMILDNPNAAPKPSDPTNPVPAQSLLPPTDPMAMFNNTISKRALFTLKLPVTASGKRIFAYARWVNQSYPENSGEWSTLMQTNVL
jgi:hypothetical protein